MVTTFEPPALWRVFDANGNPGAFFRLSTFLAGTVDTPKATFQDFEGLVSNTNPVVFGPTGEADIRFATDALYKLELRDSLGNLQWTVPNYGSISGAGASGRQSQTVQLTALAGEIEMRAVGIYPVGSIPTGGLIFIETTFGAGQSLAALAIGTSANQDVYGRGVSPLGGTITTPANYTNYNPAPVVVATDGIVRAETGGPFDGTGSLLYTAFFDVQTAAITP